MHVQLQDISRSVGRTISTTGVLTYKELKYFQLQRVTAICKKWHITYHFVSYRNVARLAFTLAGCRGVPAFTMNAWSNNALALDTKRDTDGNQIEVQDSCQEHSFSLFLLTFELQTHTCRQTVTHAHWIGSWPLRTTQLFSSLASMSISLT
jgi:hypothetical protein